GEIEPRAPHAIAGRRLGTRDSGRKDARALAQSGAPGRGFDARGNHERQRALIVDLNLSVLHTERLEHFFRLPADRVPVVGLDPRLEFNVDAAAFAGFDPHVEVRADISAPVAGFARTYFRRNC